MTTSSKDKKTGIILISLGTPESTGVRDVRKFLAEFLSDRHIISLPKFVWLPILYGPVLMLRPKKTAQAYEKIWNHDTNESPLRTIAREQADAVDARFEEDNIVIDWSFRYGSPNLKLRIEKMMAAGCERLVLFALYPQYSDTTIGSAYDKAHEIIDQLPVKPEVITIDCYHKNALYIDALKQSIENGIASIDFEPDAILASYHSIPQPYSDAGDPYQSHVLETDVLLRQALGPLKDKLHLSYQSRFGYQEWLRPYSDDKIRELATSGIKKLVVIAPGFSADCLESLEEINIQYREIFLEAGGTHFHYIPCLNASEQGIDVFEDVIRGCLD